MEKKVLSPFLCRKTYEGKSDFDKYYLDVTEKEVFKASGEIDPETGEALGVSERRLLVKKQDIDEVLKVQMDSVGVDAYIKALALQGDDIDTFHTDVSNDVTDVSNMPETLAEVLSSGEAAKAAFKKLDPALKGDHTTIEGFLNSLTDEVIDNYIKGRVDALMPQKTEVKEGE